MSAHEFIVVTNENTLNGGLGSAALNDEWPLSGIRIQWQLSGDESEEQTVACRPKSAGHHPFAKWQVRYWFRTL